MISSTVLHRETEIADPQRKECNVSGGNSGYAGTFLSSLAPPYSLDQALAVHEVLF